MLYREMLLIRRTEETILELFSGGKVSGTTHAYIGQEANAVGLIGQLDSKKDYVISNHRCHGHYLSFGGPLEGLLAEILGLEVGVCKGRGGSQHIKFGNFLSNGIQGGGAPIACGIAMGGKKIGIDSEVAAFCLGDGTLGQGVLYESLNMAALWELPVLFLLEDNGYAQTTPKSLGVSGSMIERGKSFGIESGEIESTDVKEIYEFGAQAINYVRTTGKPYWAVIHTCRLAAHSKGDDTRSEEEINCLWEKDPLAIQRQLLTEAEENKAREWVEGHLKKAMHRINLFLDATI